MSWEAKMGRRQFIRFASGLGFTAAVAGELPPPNPVDEQVKKDLEAPKGTEVILLDPLISEVRKSALGTHASVGELEKPDGAFVGAQCVYDALKAQNALGSRVPESNLTAGVETWRPIDQRIDVVRAVIKEEGGSLPVEAQLTEIKDAGVTYQCASDKMDPNRAVDTGQQMVKGFWETILDTPKNFDELWNKWKNRK